VLGRKTGPQATRPKTKRLEKEISGGDHSFRTQMNPGKAKAKVVWARDHIGTPEKSPSILHLKTNERESAEERSETFRG